MQALSRPPLAARRTSSVRTIIALMLREISMSNGRSILGYLWEILSPVVGIIVITFILAEFFRSPPIGSNFPLFYASGILPFAFFTEMATRVATSVRYSKQLLNYPGVTFLHALLARFILSVATKTIVFVVVVFAIVELYDLDTYFDYVAIAEALALTFAAGLALGAVNCLLFSLVPIYERVWMIVTRPLFLFSAIIYLFESVPLPYRDWLWWNPIIHMVGLMRRGIYPTYDAPYVSLVYIWSIILILVPVAFFFLRHYWREMLELS
jgi:capsular polysaccharide transport system permease protein